jgi:integrase/recombinase XerD
MTGRQTRDTAEEHYGANSVLESPYDERKTPPKEIDQLLAQPHGTSPAALRNRALLELLYGCGLRASEAIALEHHDVDFHAAVLRAEQLGRAPAL